jgi:hypothetical protein
MARCKIRSVWLPIGTTTGTTTTTAVFQSKTVPYFHYTPCIPSGATSGTETWQFLLGANVTGLNLSVEVDAAAPAENSVLCGSCFGSFTAPRPERVRGWRQRRRAPGHRPVTGGDALGTSRVQRADSSGRVVPGYSGVYRGS